MKKWIIYLLSVTCMSLLLCGCVQSGKQGESNTQTDSQKADSSGTNDQKVFSITKTDHVEEIINRGYVTVGVKDDVPGFSSYNKKTKNYEGGEIDLAYHIAAKIFDVSYEEAVNQKLVHFTSVLTSERESVLQEDKVDYVIATYTITKERKKEVEFSDSYYTDAIGIMINKEANDNASLKNVSIRSVADLDGKRIGIIVNSTTRESLMDYIDKNDMNITPLYMEYATYQDLSKALSAKTIDAFCVDVSILQGYMTSKTQILPARFEAQKYGVAAKHGKSDLTDVVNIVLEELEYKGIFLF